MLLRTAQALLELWDGVCAYFSAQAKPAAWTAVLLKALRLVPPETRAAAAAAAQVVPAWQREAVTWNDLIAFDSTWLACFESRITKLMLCSRALPSCEGRD